MELTPGVIVGDHYRLDSLLGVGGMGAVWKATDLSLGRVVAIKVLHADLRSDPHLNERFQREARLLAAVDHPAIVPIYAWLTLEEGGRPCPGIVMPFVKGESLADSLRRRRTIPPAESITLMRQLLDALGAAHQAGIVHRDLKPQNVMLEDRGGATLVRLLDFGVAKSLAANPPPGAVIATQVGMIIGTPEYMSPEQISDPTNVDARADLWAVSVTLFEMLTGHLPFPGLTPIETISRVLTSPPMTPSSFNPSLPGAFDAFFRRALSRQIEERPRGAADMAKQLETLLPAAGSQAAFPWPPRAEAPTPDPRAAIPQTSAQPAYVPQAAFSAQAAASAPNYAPAPLSPPQFGAAPQFGSVSGGVYVPPPAGLAPFPPGNSRAEETEKKIAMYVIIGIAVACIGAILLAALSQC